MKFIIYKVTNLLNKKIYIGKHKTHNIHDDYYGSGLLILKAIKVYGLENFRKEILFVFDTEEEMNRKEAELVNEEFLLREDTYNLRLGGSGGFDYINKNKEFKEKAINTVKNWPEEKKNEVNKKKARPGNLNGMFGRDRSGKNNPRYGVSLSQETKEKIGNGNKGKKRTAEVKTILSENTKRIWSDISKRKERSELYKMKGIKPPSPKGKLWWNNGHTVIRSEFCPGEGYIRGRKIG